MLEVNPGSETKLSGFTAVSDFKGGRLVSSFRGAGSPVSGFRYPATLSP